MTPLRFFAAILVVFHHGEQIRLNYGLPNFKEFSFFRNGGTAVTFFFVLSGFLITYKILQEKQRTKTINVKFFYLRRVLRIWPLYFLLVLIGLLVLPVAIDLGNIAYEMPYNSLEVIGYFVFFMPFMVNILYGSHLLEPLWSIGVEELFYLFWAPLFKYVKQKPLQIIVVILVLKVSLNLGLRLIPNNFEITKQVVALLQFEAMCIGAIAGFLVYNAKQKVHKHLLFTPFFQLFVFLVIFGKLFFEDFLVSEFVFFDTLYGTPIISRLLIICLFAWLIVNISLNERSLVKLQSKLLEFLDDISYGIYMFHMLVIFAIINLFKPFISDLNEFVQIGFFYGLVLSLTLLVSALSKKYFEDFFLKLNRARRHK